MGAADAREVSETILPEEALMAAVVAVGHAGRQADVKRLYFELDGKPVVRGGFYA